jgi:hypothetical protein
MAQRLVGMSRVHLTSQHSAACRLDGLSHAIATRQTYSARIGSRRVTAFPLVNTWHRHVLNSPPELHYQRPADS